MQLHAFAAYYPDHPTSEDASAACGLVSALVRAYPCAHCRRRLAVDVDAHPVSDGRGGGAVASRAALSVWMCEHHNRVNRELGKREFPCDLPALDARWRTGAARCWPAGDATAADSLGRGSPQEEAEERE